MNLEHGLVVQVITIRTGGGAELLVRELHTRIAAKGINSRAIYFNIGTEEELEHGELSLDLNSHSPLAIFALRKIFKSLVGEHGQVVVHAHLTWPFIYVALATLFLNIKLVYTEHNITNRRRNIRGAAFLDRLLYRRYDRVICISRGVFDSLAAWVGPGLKDRLRLVTNGSRLFQVKPRMLNPSELPRLISVGTLTKKKGFEVSIEAVAKIADSIHSYTIVGEGPERRALEAQIQALGLDHKVRLAGWTDNMQGVFHGAHIQLIPSLWEGFGLVAVEGMSTGIPVIASDVGGLREVLDPDNPSVRLIETHRDPAQWVAAIQDVTSRLALGDELHLSSRAQAEKFSLEAMVDAYLAIYAELK
ncbi:glycosyltransferase [Halopseudomonas sp.]|uniref:glycosyltransferase n=1 Tax=Halopseudomonas sp. TaxID=2901191 RepID=UPI003001540F